LRLEPDLAEAHYARGMILWGPRNHFAFEFAVREYRRAIELNPNLDDAHHQLGVLYLHVGLLDKAVTELEKTLALDPGNRFAEHRIGVALVDQGRYEEGLRALRAVPPSFNPSLWYYHVAWVLLYLGRDGEASTLIDEYLLKYPEDRGGVVTSIRAILRAKRGDVQGAEHDIAIAKARGAGYVHFHHTEYNIASAYALMRQPRAAIHWLERAADDGWPCYPYFARDPNLDNIRADPAFITFLMALRRQWEHYRAVL
jgi:tetratricopeptide (TPR) repeat protein